MKKINGIFIALLAVLLVVPCFSVRAAEISVSNLNDTLVAEGKEAVSDYTEADNQAIVYLFRGSGCSHCSEFLDFLRTLAADEEYRNYFKVRSYEVWYNDANSELLAATASYLGEKAGGVPYFVIGGKGFSGYNSELNEDIKAAIKAEYDAGATNNTVDYVIEHLDEINKSASNRQNAIMLLCLAAVAGLVCYLVSARNNISVNKNYVDEFANDVETAKEEVKETVKEVKSKAKAEVAKKAKKKNAKKNK